MGEVSGQVKCLETCPELTVSLKPVRGESGGARTTTTSEGLFSFTEVVPGAYVVTIHKDDWCWSQKTVNIVINTQDVDVVMEQTGYRLTLAASHETLLNYKTSNEETGVLQIQKGTTKECISKPGVYTFTPHGCHKFSSLPIQWDTKHPNLITLAATHHIVTGKILSKEAVNFTVSIKGSSGQVVNLGPLEVSKDDAQTYVFEHWAKENEAITITPGSDSNLYQFKPSSYQLTMPSECFKNAVTFKAEKALFINGRVLPDISGVTIKVTGNGETFTFKTNAEGYYTAGPLDNSVDYSISAEKKGYMMKDLPDKGFFEAYKLAEIIVTVKDENGKPLSGVLVSTSGGKSYRQNSLTENDGSISFQALMPSDYFLRPIMKEYTFEPPSKMVTVKEGATVEVTISGSRVAYSVFGQTVSLSGEHETEVTVETVGIGEGCSQYQEEAVSDDHGYFRIRGLLPKCEYDLRLKKGKNINQNVERTVPASQRIKILNEDIRDLKLIVLRPFLQMDVAVMVDTEPEYLSSLVAKMYRDDLPDSPIHTIKMGLHPYFLFPPMIADQRTYTFQLQSSLSSSQYNFNSPEVTFVADSAFKHLSLSFNPVLRSVDAEMNRGTVVGLTLAIFLVILAFNYRKIGPCIERLAELYSNVTTAKSNPTTPFDSPQIELVSKKKVKSRKI